MEQEQAAFHHHLGRQQYAARSIKNYVRVVNVLVQSIPEPSEYSSRKIADFLSRPRATGGPPSPETRNAELTAIRAWCRYLVEEGLLENDPSLTIRYAKPPRRDPPTATQGEVRALFIEAAKLKRLPERALALVALLYGAALRVSEAVRLDLDQIDFQAMLLVGVEGKAGTRIDVPLSSEVASLLRAYISTRDPGPGPCFPPLSVMAIFRFVRCSGFLPGYGWPSGPSRS